MRPLWPENLADFLLFRDQLGDGSRRLGAALNPGFCLLLVDFECSAAGGGGRCAFHHAGDETVGH